jgi:S1-C subfamily serine protease
MFKYVATFLTSLLLFFKPVPIGKVLDKVDRSVVRVTATIPGPDDLHSICTGFVIAPDEVLTANHCIYTMLQVNGAAADILKTDAYYDLALLHVETNRQPLPLSDTPPVRFEELTAIGYANGWPILTDLNVRVLLVNFIPVKGEAPVIMVQGPLIPGMSGGPMVNKDGEVVAISQATNEVAGLGTGTLLIRAFLLGVG